MDADAAIEPGRFQNPDVLASEESLVHVELRRLLPLDLIVLFDTCRQLNRLAQLAIDVA